MISIQGKCFFFVKYVFHGALGLESISFDVSRFISARYIKIKLRKSDVSFKIKLINESWDRYRESRIKRRYVRDRSIFDQHK